MFHTLRIQIKSMARWESSTVRLLGIVEIFLGMALIAPAIVALIYDEDPMVFMCTVPILLALGSIQFIFFKGGEGIKPAGGMLMVFLAWWIAFFVSSVPFYLSGYPFVDSLFESVSGFTTTGISMVSDTSAPHSVLFWGAITQWAGGIAVVLVFLFLLPMMGIGGKALVNNEIAGSETYNFSMRVKGAVKNFISMYVLLSIVEAALLMVSGVGAFESVTMMFSTISTGGFMAVGGSMGDYSFAAQVIVLAFMFLGGTNFFLHYRALNKRDFSAYRTSQEFIWTVIWFLLATVIVVTILLIKTDDASAAGLGDTVWGSLFTVVSMGTTTGYMMADQPVWPLATYIVLWMVMLFGSMSGSTSGGIKIYRLLILKSYINNGIHKMFHPRLIRDVKMDGHSVNNDAVVSAIVVVVMFVVVLIFSMMFLLVSEPGMSISDSIGLSISAISNSGVNAGGMTFSELGDVSKVFLTFIMWVGRMEVVVALLMFTRTFWSDLIKDAKNGRRSTRKLKN